MGESKRQGFVWPPVLTAHCKPCAQGLISMPRCTKFPCASVLSQLGGSEVPSGSGNDRAAVCLPGGLAGLSSPSSCSPDRPALAHLLCLHPGLRGEVLPQSFSGFYTLPDEKTKKYFNFVVDEGMHFATSNRCRSPLVLFSASCPKKTY